jgi:hypothetical protein
MMGELQKKDQVMEFYVVKSMGLRDQQRNG